MGAMNGLASGAALAARPQGEYRRVSNRERMRRNRAAEAQAEGILWRCYRGERPPGDSGPGCGRLRQDDATPPEPARGMTRGARVVDYTGSASRPGVHERPAPRTDLQRFK